MGVENEESVLWHLVRMVVYPWCWWERFQPSKYRERSLERKIEALTRTRQSVEDLQNLEKQSLALESARGDAWFAQLLLYQLIQTCESSKPLPESTWPSEGWQLLKEAEKAITRAIRRQEGYAALTLRAHIRVLIGLNSQANVDFQNAMETPEAPRITKGREFQRRALKLWKARKWTPARKCFWKSVRFLPVERIPAHLFQIAKRFEKVEEILKLCTKTRIVTIGRSRVRYLRYLVELLDEVQTIFEGAQCDFSYNEKLGNEVKEAALFLSGLLKKAIEKEKKEQPSSGKFYGMLERSEMKLETLCVKFRSV